MSAKLVPLPQPKYPLVLAAAQREESVQWELGDALIAAIPADTPYQLAIPILREIVEELSSYGIHRSADGLYDLRSAALKFPKGQRHPRLGHSLHKAAGDPDTLNAMLRAIPKGHRLTFRDVVRIKEDLLKQRPIRSAPTTNKKSALPNGHKEFVENAVPRTTAVRELRTPKGLAASRIKSELIAAHRLARRLQEGAKDPKLDSVFKAFDPEELNDTIQMLRAVHRHILNLHGRKAVIAMTLVNRMKAP